MFLSCVPVISAVSKYSYENSHMRILSHMSLDTVPERPSNLMLEVVKFWAISVYSSLLSFFFFF